ncbi:hypothetical protein QOZ80_7AG0567720 [Eleusine coracana subsp. coracana]|nr:hypothetical protein QOZ80_7AG0567720 [Eleusine coracana subsp. coracana]
MWCQRLAPGLIASVPVGDLVDGKRGRRFSRTTTCFDHQVTSAPIRTLRLDVFQPTVSLLDQWIAIALNSGVDLKLRYFGVSDRIRLCPFGPYEESSVDFHHQRGVKTPTRLFRCSTLQCLRLTNWTLELFPSSSVGGDVCLPSLETLFLKRIAAPASALQRPITSCPRLADLTLEECPGATEINVTSNTCLTSFAMACCHRCTRIVVDNAQRLRSLRYKGGLLQPEFLSLGKNHTALTALTVDICDCIDGKKPNEIATVRRLIVACANLTFLHLALRPAMAYHSSLFTNALRGLPRLRQLELKGLLRCGYNHLNPLSVKPLTI